MRLPTLAYTPLQIPNQSVQIVQRGIFRRFLFDGMVVARAEMGYRLRARDTDSHELAQAELTGDDCLKLVNGILEAPMLVRAGKISESREAINTGDLLAKHLLRASTRRTNGTFPEIRDWWVRPGSPLLLLEGGPAELTTLPKQAKTVESPLLSAANLHLSFVRIVKRNIECSVWFVQIGKECPRELARKLRINLVRFHAEFEVLKAVVRLIQSGKLPVKRGSVQSDMLQNYLANSVSFLKREFVDGIPQSAIADVVWSAQQFLNEGERKTLLVQLSNIRRNPLNAVGELLEAGARKLDPTHVTINVEKLTMHNQSITVTHSTIHGNINQVAAQNITDSFNAAEKVPNADLKAKLEELAKAVGEMCKTQEGGKQEEITRDLKALTEEAASPQPRRKWYELSAEGLIEAATAVGKIGEPVITAARAVLALLA